VEKPNFIQLHPSRKSLLHFSLAFGATLLLIACGAGGQSGTDNSTAASSTTGSPNPRSLDGRTYTVYLPASYDTVSAIPLVVALHGYSSDGAGEKAVSGYYQLSNDAQDGFVIVYPDGVGNSWNAGPTCCGVAAAEGVDDVGFLAKMVESIRNEWPKIDSSRVYATGLSNGSAMAQRLGAEASETFAAGAGYSQRLLVPAPADRQPFAYIDFAGYQDDVVPYYGGFPYFFPSVADNTAAWVQLDGCSASPWVETLSPPGPGSQPNQCVHYDGCEGGVSVVFCGIQGGHIIEENGVFDVASMGWQFMKGFHR
jgi:polyhydroxybutyrate depolymerase